MEARLTETPAEARIRVETQSGNSLALQAAQPAPDSGAPLLHGLTQRIDRYLRAAGVHDETQRARLTAAAARDMLAQGASAEPSWAELIAAVDRSISSGGAREGGLSVMTSARGRVALRLLGDPAALPEEWGTPPRHRRAMVPQDLSLWRPRQGIGADRLHRLSRSRPLQALTACLCWLAVLIVP